MKTYRAIDFRVNLPTEEGMRPFYKPGKHLQGYVETYSTWFQKYQECVMPPDKFLAFMDAEGVDVGVFFAMDAQTTMGPESKISNEGLAEFCRHAPDRFIGFAGVDPHKGMAAVRELEHAIKGLGLKGLNMGPWLHKIYANDRRYYPIYAKCCELNIPAILHTSMNFSRDLVMDAGHPRYLDDVCREFPELRIIASHAGWPWVLDMVGLAWRHPSVYIEFSAIRPKYIGTPGTGWEPLIRYGNTLLQDRVLWATDYPDVGMKQTIEEVRALPLKEEVKEKWLWKNAARLLGLIEE